MANITEEFNKRLGIKQETQSPPMPSAKKNVSSGNLASRFMQTIAMPEVALGESALKVGKPLAIGAKTVLGNILKQVSRPGYAVTTAIDESIKKPSFKAPFKGAVKGFMLQDPKSGYDILETMKARKEAEKNWVPKPAFKNLENFAENMAIPVFGDEKTKKRIAQGFSKLGESEAGKRALGFGIDVATDPLNIFAKGIGKGVGGAAKYVKAKVGLPLAKTKIGQTIGGIFSKDFGLKTKYPELAKEAAFIDDLLKYEQLKSVEEAKRVATLVPDVKERKLITNILENPEFEGAFSKLSKTGQKVVGWLKKVRERTGKTFVKNEMLPEERLLDFYVRHARTEKPGVITWVKRALKEASPSSLKKRKIEGTIQKINERLGKPFFEEDIAIIHGISQAEARKAFAAHDYLRKLAENPTITEPLEAGNKLAKEGFEVINHPLFEGKQVPAEVAKHIKSLQKSYVNDESLNAVIKGYDKVLNWWKGQVLISPAYHFRNMIGNYWNNWIGGVTNPQRYLQAGALQKAGKRGTKGLRGVALSLGQKKYRGNELMDLAQKYGVVDSGWYGADIPETVTKQIKGLNWKPWTKEFRGYHPIRLNREVGSLVENNARLAHFIDRLEKGDDAASAALSTKKYLFDYTDLAPTEKDLLKRVFPFYTWSRKNIPLQLQSMILKPGKYATLEKGIRAIQLRGQEKDIENMPSWMKERLGVPLFKKDNDVFAMVMENWIPAADVNKLVRPEEIINMASPLIKTPLEQAANHSFFFNKPLEEYEGQTQPWGTPKKAIDVSSRNVHPWMSQVRVLNELNRLAQNYDQWPEYVRFLTGGKLYKYDPEIQKTYELLKKNRKLNDLIGFMSLVSKRGIRTESKTKKEHSKREVQRIKNKLFEEVKK